MPRYLILHVECANSFMENISFEEFRQCRDFHNYTSIITVPSNFSVGTDRRKNKTKRYYNWKHSIFIQ